MTDRTLTVTELNSCVKALLEADGLLADIYVKGEISNFTNHYKTGHFYFSLKDDGGVLDAVMFKGYNSRLKFTPENGMKVIAHGRISAYVKSGKYQLYCDDMQPDGVGALYIAFEQLKAKLEAEGLFAASHKKPIPRYPGRIGIVTSATGAAIRDMINVSSRRFPLSELVLFPCLVQGDGAAAQIRSGVRFFNNYDVDVIIIGRGGGSIEDLWAFNDEALAREIYASEKPVISAVGHEIDFSISDFVADLRAPTPSAAAELALPDSTEVKKKLQNLGNHFYTLLLSQLANRKDRLESLRKKPCLVSYQNYIDEKRLAVDELSKVIDRSADRILERKRLLLSNAAGHLEALNPLSVISRGYSAVFDGSGKLIRSVNQLSVGENIGFQACDGRVSATVVQIDSFDNERKS